MKGKQCKHSIALMYFTNRWFGEAEVRYVPLGKKRKPGRPKKNPHCLLRSPGKIVPDTPIVYATHEEIEIDDPEPEPANIPLDQDQEPSSIPLRKSSRRKAATTGVKKGKS